jgi:hypothetical protein
MAKVKYFVLAAAAALAYTASAKDAPANNADATRTAEKTAQAGPTNVALVTMEKSAYAAWKSKDAKFWDTFLSDKFVGWAALAKPAGKKQAPQKAEAQSADASASTDAMLAVEKTVWEAWRAHDGKKIEDLTAKEISFIGDAWKWTFGINVPARGVGT